MGLLTEGEEDEEGAEKVALPFRGDDAVCVCVCEYRYKYAQAPQEGEKIKKHPPTHTQTDKLTCCS
jgi:hypothetical protein